jgi:hypothetical protein
MSGWEEETMNAAIELFVRARESAPAVFSLRYADAAEPVAITENTAIELDVRQTLNWCSATALLMIPSTDRTAQGTGRLEIGRRPHERQEPP